MNRSLNAWFVQEILAHEAALVRYLARNWPARDEIHDLRQETYLRVYEAAAKTRPDSGKAFLFTTARHLMIDRVRRNRVVAIELVSDPDTLNVSVDEMSPERHASGHDELRMLLEALERLPPRCREVVLLRKVEGLSQKQIAAKMSICESVVEKHLAKAMRRLADALFGGECDEEANAGAHQSGQIEGLSASTGDSARQRYYG